MLLVSWSERVKARGPLCYSRCCNIFNTMSIELTWQIRSDIVWNAANTITWMSTEVTQHSKQAATGKRKAETYFYQRTIHVSHVIDHNYTLFWHYFGELAATFHRRISGKFAISLICNPLFLSLDSRINVLVAGGKGIGMRKASASTDQQR